MHQLPAFANMTMSVRRELCAVMVFAVVERAGTIVLNDGEEVGKRFSAHRASRYNTQMEIQVLLFPWKNINNKINNNNPSRIVRYILSQYSRSYCSILYYVSHSIWYTDSAFRRFLFCSAGARTQGVQCCVTTVFFSSLFPLLLTSWTPGLWLSVVLWKWLSQMEKQKYCAWEIVLEYKEYKKWRMRMKVDDCQIWHIINGTHGTDWPAGGVLGVEPGPCRCWARVVLDAGLWA